MDKLKWSPLSISSLTVSGLALLTVLGALAFEHIGGYPPCHLCLQERYAYYFAVPVAAIAFGLSFARPGLARILLSLVMIAFAVNVLVSVYHVGVEVKWWDGPASCTGGAAADDWEALAEQLKQTSVVRCDEPALTVLGLSLAAWNGIVSLILAGIAVWGMTANRTRGETPSQGAERPSV